MYYQSIMEKLLDDDNNDIIELQPEGGKVLKFEQIAVVIYEETPYAIMHPMDMPDEEVVIFELNMDDEDALELVTDEELAKKVLEVYDDDIEK